MLHVLYGSATGTSQDVAEQIGRMAGARRIQAHVLSMDDLDIQLLPTLQYVVFVASSTGDGEAPENMSNFWKFLLRKSLPTNALEGLQIAVFGLGDSSYAKYNVVARRLQARLLQLGAKEIIDRGLGDDQHELGYHGTLNPWLTKLWNAMLQQSPYILPPDYIVDDSPKQTPQKYRVEFLENASTIPPMQNSFYDPPKTACTTQLINATLKKNERLTSADWTQDVRHVELDISTANVSYSPGDIALLYPENVRKAEITSFLTRMNLKGSSVVSISRIDGCHDLPSPCSIEDLMVKYLDIFGTPRRSFFERLSLFAHDDEEKEKLMELATPEGADLLHDYCTRERRTYVEIFDDFKSCHVPLEYLLELIPRMTPRAYSIASSSMLHPTEIQLTVAIVDYSTPYKRQKKGTCSAWLETLTPPTTIPIWIKSGLFKLTRAIHRQNMLLIGPGTGIAVMRSIAQERQVLRRVDTENVGETHVYFGCRHEKKDYLYGYEWQSMVSNGDISSLQVAFSRDQTHKIYVQGKLAEQKETVFGVLSQGGYCFVAGSAKRMPTDVYETIRDIISSEGNVSLKEADTFMKNLVRQKRYVVESWS